MASDDSIPSAETPPLSFGYESEPSEELRTESYIVSCISWGLLILAAIAAIYFIVQAEHAQKEVPQAAEFEQKV